MYIFLIQNYIKYNIQINMHTYTYINILYIFIIESIVIYYVFPGTIQHNFYGVHDIDYFVCNDIVRN